MFKLIGLMALTISMGLIGIYKYLQLKRRKELLEEFYQMIGEIKSQINYFKEPLPDMFNKIASKCPLNIQTLLIESSNQLMVKHLQIAEIWPIKVKEIYKGEPLNQDDLNTLCYLGSFIGQTDYENQIYHFEYLEKQLATQISDSLEEIKSKGPLYKKIGFFIGILISLIFI